MSQIKIFASEKQTQQLYKIVQNRLIQRLGNCRDKKVTVEAKLKKPLDVFEVACMNEQDEKINPLWHFMRLVKAGKTRLNVYQNATNLICLLGNIDGDNNRERDQLCIVIAAAALELSTLPSERQAEIFEQVKQRFPNHRLEEPIQSKQSCLQLPSSVEGELLSLEKKLGRAKFLELMKKVTQEEGANDPTQPLSPPSSSGGAPPPPPPTGAPPPPVYVNKGYKKKVTSRTPSGTTDNSGEELTLLDQLKKGTALNKTGVDLISGKNPNAKKVPDEKNHMSELFSKIKRRGKKIKGEVTPDKSAPSNLGKKTKPNSSIKTSPKIEKKKNPYQENLGSVYEIICKELSLEVNKKAKLINATQLFQKSNLMTEVNEASEKIKKTSILKAHAEPMDCFWDVQEYIDKELLAKFKKEKKEDLADSIKFLFICAVAAKKFPRKIDFQIRKTLIKNASEVYKDHGIQHPYLKKK